MKITKLFREIDCGRFPKTSNEIIHEKFKKGETTSAPFSDEHERQNDRIIS